MEALLSQIRDTERFLVVSHINPDGDAVGSALAMVYGLRQLGKEANLVLKDGIPRSFAFLAEEGMQVLTEMPEPDTVTTCLVTDAPDMGRTGFRDRLRAYADRQHLLVIDHHPAGDLVRVGTAAYHELKTSSACEMAYEILVRLGVKLTAQISTCLLTGMHTDTSGFRFSNTSTRTLEIAAELMRRGAKLNTIITEVSQHKTIGNLRLLGLAMRRLRTTNNNQVSTSLLTLADVAEYEADTDDVHGIIGQLSVIPDSKITLFLSEAEPGLYRGSLRSKDFDSKSVNVSQLARLLGGGGHAKASGFSITGTLSKKEAKNGDEYWQIT